MMVIMSHLAAVSALNCGRSQYGLSPCWSIVEPQAPRVETMYAPKPYFLSSSICSWKGYVWFPPVLCTPAVIESPTQPT